MAEIILPPSNHNIDTPEGNFIEWTEGKSTNDKTFYHRGVDSGSAPSGQTEEQSHQLGSHGPPFNDVPVNWPPGTSGNTSPEIAAETGITWYKLENTVGITYQLTINTTMTYDYTFITPVDSYDLTVDQTWTTHEVTYSSLSPTIIGISGR